jgi:hypothetical protein
VTTLRALQDGWYQSPRIINRCCDGYERILGEEETELVDSTTQDGGVHFEAEVREYVHGKNREQTMNLLMDTRTSDFYSQLFDLQVRRYRGAQAHSALVLKANNLTIPEKYGFCSSYQTYVEHVVADEQERRIFLIRTLRRAKQLLYAIKVVAEGSNVQDDVLEVLKRKVLALQEHYRDATALVSAISYDLFDQGRDDWWYASVRGTRR